MRKLLILAVVALAGAAFFSRPRVAGASGPDDRLDLRLKLLHALQTPAAQASASGVASESAREHIRAVILGGGRPAGLRTPHSRARALHLLLDTAATRGQLESVGFRTEARVGRFVTGTLPEERLGDLASLPGVVAVQLAQSISAVGVHPTRAVVQAQDGGNRRAGASPVHAPMPHASSLASGAGVIVASIDTGVDVFHQDFRKADGTTRIKYLLDLSDPGDPDGDGVLNGPQETFGGTLYTEAQINAALSLGTFASRDTVGHGTHSLSVAAGDDAALPGVAPSSDLIVVKATREAGSLGFDSVDVMNALTFVDEQAEQLGQPYVVGLSLGTLFSSHDGRSLEEQFIDQLAGPGKEGKVVVLAAGNSSSSAPRFHHFQGTAHAGMATTHTLHVPSYTPGLTRGSNLILIDLWYTGGDRLTVSVTDPHGTRHDAEYLESFSVATPDGNVYIANVGGVDPTNGDVEALIVIDDWSGIPPAGADDSLGDWTITLTGESIRSTGRYHGWLLDESVVGNKRPWLSANADNEYLVGKPGAARNGIAVASWARPDAAGRYRTAWTDVNASSRTCTTLPLGACVENDISTFSSPGRTRDGRMKPDIAAPGEFVMGALSRDAYPPGVTPPPGFEGSDSSVFQYLPDPAWPPEALVTDRDANHGFGMLGGTSFAAPVVAGLAARILADDNTLDTIQVRNVLKNSAIVDAAVTANGTRPVPNGLWGWGKADLALGSGPAPGPGHLAIDTETIPSGVVGQPYSAVLIGSGGTLPYSWAVTNGSLPAGLALDGSLIAGTPAAAGSFSFTVTVTDSSLPTQTKSRAFDVSVDAESNLRVDTTALLPGVVNQPYEATLEASGGTPPYTWTLAGGSLPVGFSLAPAGTITGTGAGLADMSFTVQVTDSIGGQRLQSLRLQVTIPGADVWLPLGSGTQIPTSIGVDPTDTEHLVITFTQPVAGGGPNHSQGGVPADILESRDGGASWTNIASNSDGSRNNLMRAGINNVVLDPTTGTPWGVGELDETRTSFHWRYEPGQNQWTHITQTQGAQGAEFAAKGFYIGTHTTVIRSTDGGDTWVQLGTKCRVGWQTDRIAVYDAAPVVYLIESPPTAPGPAFVVCRSSDDGATWVEMTSPPTLSGTASIRVSQADPNDIVATDHHPLGKINHNVFVRSTDGGATWVETPIEGAAYMQYFDRSRTEPGVFVATAFDAVTLKGALFRSTDFGANWARIEPPSAGGRINFAIHPQDAETLYAVTDTGLFVTKDGGATWQQRGQGIVFARRQVLGPVAFHKTDPANALLLANEGLYDSLDGGDHWTLTDPACKWNGNETLLAPLQPAGCLGKYSAGVWRMSSVNECLPPVTSTCPDKSREDRLRALESSAAEAGLWYAVRDWPYDPNANPPLPSPTGTLMRSTTAGAGWEIIDLPGWKARAVAADPSLGAGVMVAAYQVATGFHRILRSTDYGATFPNVVDLGAEVNDVAYGLIAGLAYAATNEGIYRSTDGGVSWGPVSASGDAKSVTPAPSDALRAYAVMGTLFYLDPADGLWKSAATGPSAGTVVSEIGVDPQTATTAYVGTTAGLYRTTDGGVNWSSVGGPLGAFKVLSVASDPANPGTVLAVTAYAGLYRSTNWGTTWQRDGEFGLLAGVSNVIVSPQGNPQSVYAGTEGFGVQRSSDGGRTFTPAVQGLTNLYVNALAFDPDNSQVLYAGTDAGIFHTLNGGDTWQSGTGLSGEVTDIVVHNLGLAKRLWGTVRHVGVARSTDGGTTFDVFTNGLDSLDLTSIDITDQGAAKRLWGTAHGGAGVFYSDALGDPQGPGQLWQGAAGNGLTSRGLNDIVVQQTASAKRLWGTTRDDGVFYSDDDGLSWTNLSLGLPAGVPVTSISINPLTEEAMVSLFSAENGGVYRGGNENGIWSAFNDGLSELRLRKLTNDGGHGSGTGTTFYAATAGAVAYARDVLTGTGGPIVSTTSLPAVLTRAPYYQTLAATGGSGGYEWSMASGALPPGLQLEASGEISGSPGRAGVYGFTPRVTDALGRRGTKTLTIKVSDSRALSISDVNVTEGETGSVAAVFTVIVSPSSSEEVTVAYGTGGAGTATAGVDYSSVSGTLSFVGGASSATFSVPVLGDLLDEPSETFFLSLSGPVGAVLLDSQGRGTIEDDDPVPPGSPSVAISDVTMTEGNSGPSNARFTVALSAASATTVAVSFVTSGSGTATEGVDYTAHTGLLEFASGETSKTVDVVVVGDAFDEPNETFFTDLSSPVNATVADARGQGTIVDNDDAPGLAVSDATVAEGDSGTTTATFRVTMATSSQKTVTVAFANGGAGTATVGADYAASAGTLTFVPGDTLETLSLLVLGDLQDEANETFYVNLSSAVNATLQDGQAKGTIADNDPTPTLSFTGGPAADGNRVVTEGDTAIVNATFAVNLSAASGRKVTLNFGTGTGGTALSGTDYAPKSGTLTFNVGETQKTFTVQVLPDAAEEVDETFFVNLSGAVSGAILDGQASGTIADNDPPPPGSPSVSVGDVTVTEGDSGTLNAVFTITLSAASTNTVTVPYTTGTGGTATAAVDYITKRGTFTFLPGQTSKTLGVTVVGDTVDEADETFFFNLTSAAFATIGDGQGRATIADDDP